MKNNHRQVGISWCHALGFRRGFRGAALLAGMLAAALCFSDAKAAQPAAQDDINQALAGSWRSPENRARDRYRHPAQTLAFFHVTPTVNLIEITPGAGWYAEILAPALKAHGSYTAAVVNPEFARPQQQAYQKRYLDELRAKFAADPARYGKAHIVEFNPMQPIFGEPASADVVVSFRNVHNWVQAGTENEYFKAFFAVLKPGGVLGIVDHRAVPGSPLDKSSGYLPEEYVINLAVAAGFQLDGRSEINANPRDTKDYPKGVWTLPPTLILGDRDRGKYLAIGESDRFTLRFIKPVGKVVNPANPSTEE